MMSKIFYCFLLISICLTANVFSQSSLLEDGVGGSGFFVESFIDDNGFNSVGLTASYSLGGIMDFGVKFVTESDSIDNNESTNLYFSLLYNMIIIKQTHVQPFNIQLEGAYGYMNTASDYLDYYNRSRTGQGFELGAALFHNLFRASIVGVTLGGKLNYKNYINTTSDYTDPDALETVSELRTETIKYGGFAGISLHPDLWPIFTLELLVIYNDAYGKLEYCPSFSIINPDF